MTWKMYLKDVFPNVLASLKVLLAKKKGEGWRILTPVQDYLDYLDSSPTVEGYFSAS